MSMYSYCMFMYLHRASWHSSATLTEVFPCFFLSCKANSRVKPAKTEYGSNSSNIFVLFYILFVLCRSVYCLCVNVNCTTATGWQPNCSLHIYHIKQATEVLKFALKLQAETHSQTFIFYYFFNIDG